MDSDRTVNVIVGAMGEIVINEGKDVKQVKVLILYNTIRKLLKLAAITYTVYLFEVVPVIQ